MFQSYALFPHLTVFENVAFGLRRQRVSGAALSELVEAALAMVRLPGLAARRGEIIAGIRPEDMDDARLAPGHPADQRLRAPVVLTESLGSDQMVHFTVDAPVAKVADQDSLDEIVVGTGSGICIGRFGARSTARAGEVIDVAVDCSRLHFFDAATGLAI